MPGTMCRERVIRAADAADIASMARLERRAQLHPWSFATFVLAFSREPRNIYVALDGDGICGFICAWPVPGEIQIHNLCVDPAWRGCGIGRHLLEQVLRDASDAGCTVFLEVRAGNLPALELYRSTGFRVAGLRRDYYRDPSEDAVLMSYDIG